MDLGECQRILGVAPNASAQQIRQAYQDLVRVWHPDRFHSDSRLQQIAQERLREINDAYTCLKNYSPPVPNQETATSPPRASNDQPQKRKTWTPPAPASRTRPSVGLPHAFAERTARTAMIGLLCAVPFLFAVQFIRLLRVPVVDAQMIAERTLKPDILAPMRIIDPSIDVRAAANMMTEWARGDVIDLWQPAPTSLKAHFGSILASSTAAPSPATADIRKSSAVGARNHSRPITEAKPLQLASGTELIEANRSRAPGYLRLANHTKLEAIVKVVSDRMTRRAVYIRPGESAVVRSVKIGVYDLHVELGNDVDLERLQFRKNRYTPEPLGPFEFHEITSESGVMGRHYEVALNPR